MSKINTSSVFYKIKDKLRKKDAKIHFIGILGAGMLPLARLMQSRGYTVGGSDISSAPGAVTAGIDVKVEHSTDNVRGADLVVYSHAIAEDNPERSEARKLGILTVTRAELLGFVISEYKHSVGISGTHGKSTTVAMLASIFKERHPTVLCGADMRRDGGLLLGDGDYFIYEACEYKDSFLAFYPNVALFLNLELDHTDYFESIEALRASFLKCSSNAEITVINTDDENLEKIAKKTESTAITFGSSSGCDYRYTIKEIGRTSVFSLYKRKKHLGDFSLSLPGTFNIKNAVAAAVTALELGLSPEEVKKGLREFSGIPRRLERIKSYHGGELIYDYAHHPSEISAGISAIRASGAELVTVVFCPHTYSRTKSLWDGFVSSLSEADRIILVDIFPAREEAIEGISSERLAAAIGEKAEYADSPERAAELASASRGSVVLMGAGDLSEVKRLLLRRI